MVGGGGEQERKVSAKDGRGREERGERRGEKSKEQSEWRGVKGGEKEKRRKECKWYECGRGGFVYSQTRVRRKQSRALPTRFEIGFGAGSNMRQQHSTEVERRNEKQQTTQAESTMRRAMTATRSHPVASRSPSARAGKDVPDVRTSTAIASARWEDGRRRELAKRPCPPSQRLLAAEQQQDRHPSVPRRRGLHHPHRPNPPYTIYSSATAVAPFSAWQNRTEQRTSSPFPEMK